MTQAFVLKATIVTLETRHDLKSCYFFCENHGKRVGMKYIATSMKVVGEKLQVGLNSKEKLHHGKGCLIRPTSTFRRPRTGRLVNFVPPKSI